jgi:putative ABC transport system permease protein
VTVLTGLVSGSYPALYLSGLKPVRVLKGTLKDRGSRGSLFRKVLVVAQFTVSLILIISTMIFSRQLRYIHDKPLGFDRDQILVLRNNSGPVFGDLAPLKTALLQDPRIAGVCGSEQLPSSIGQYNNVTWEGAAPGEKIEIMCNRIDYDFLETYGIGLAAGRNFSPEFPGDLRMGTDPQSARGVLLNEEAVRRMGWSDPIGKQVVHVWGNNKTYWTVVGVVKDFHFTSLRNAIRPMNFFLSTRMNRYVSVKLGGEDLPGTVGFIEATWRRLYPGLPFDGFFLDSVFDRLYRSEERQRQLFGVLSGHGRSSPFPALRIEGEFSPIPRMRLIYSPPGSGRRSSRGRGRIVLDGHVIDRLDEKGQQTSRRFTVEHEPEKPKDALH